MLLKLKSFRLKEYRENEEFSISSLLHYFTNNLYNLEEEIIIANIDEVSFVLSFKFEDKTFNIIFVEHIFDLSFYIVMDDIKDLFKKLELNTDDFVDFTIRYYDETLSKELGTDIYKLVDLRVNKKHIKTIHKAIVKGEDKELCAILVHPSFEMLLDEDFEDVCKKLNL